jgi:DNA processing protein
MLTKKKSNAEHESDLKYKIALTMVPKVGHLLAKKLVAYCGSAEAVFREKKGALLKIPNIGPSIAQSISAFKQFKSVEFEINYAAENGINVLYYLDEVYPYRLKECYDAPVILYTKGKIALNPKRVIAIVGTRNPTQYGREITEHIIQELADCNVTIVSGMAYGVDIIGHKAALQNQLNTIGVLAHGLGTMYPAAHRSFAEKMVNKGQGVLISEYGSQVLAEREYFPMRNRIVAGLADATVVVESKLSGGSLITAEIANAYARDVFAFPGKANDEFSAGCNKLIKTNKAALIDNADDIKYLMRWLDIDLKKIPEHSMENIASIHELTNTQIAVLSLLQTHKSLQIDQIMQILNIASSELAIILFELEMKAIVKALPGKQYSMV